MKKEIWITTNQQPWVEALAAGVITVKTRTSFPRVPVGATILLHASKSRLWPHWKELSYLLDHLPEKNHERWGRGAITAIGIVERVDFSENILTNPEYKFWNVDESEKFHGWNSAGEYAVRFRDVLRLNKPVLCRGFQAPFCHAKKEIIEKVIRANAYLPYTYFE